MNSQNTEVKQITATIGNYYGGWYAFDTKQISSAMHPMIAKRNVEETDMDSEALIHTTNADMVRYTAKRGGDTIPDTWRAYTITKVEHYEEIASATVESGAYIEYLHLAKQHGQWRIVNVLWTYNRDFLESGEMRDDPNR